MGSTMGTLLPHAVAAALSPAPMIAGIFLLFAARKPGASVQPLSLVWDCSGRIVLFISSNKTCVHW
jgi:hypothetical protein